MTATAPELGEPRWHADPAGGAGLRWWDGTQWTTAVMGPAELGPPVQQPLPAETPVFTASLWAIVFLPLLSTLGALVIPAASLTLTVPSQPGGQFEQAFEPSGLIRTALGLAIYGAAVALAFLDRRTLLRAGYVRPFHWAWAFLSAGVYVVGRSIIVQHRIGRGLAPIWVWTGVAVLGLIVSFTASAQLLMASLGQPFPG
ncbi:DUF2510 domain-containing protein [Cryobacterium sp. AP23]